MLHTFKRKTKVSRCKHWCGVKNEIVTFASQHIAEFNSFNTELEGDWLGKLQTSKDKLFVLVYGMSCDRKCEQNIKMASSE